MHNVAVIAMHGVIPFDFAMACETFGHVFPPGKPEPVSRPLPGIAEAFESAFFTL